MVKETCTAFVISCWSMEDRGRISKTNLFLLSCFRGDVQREREREEQRVAEVSQNLERYKREIGNCQTAAREIRQEEARLAEQHDRFMEEAEQALRQARLAEEEAARLEKQYIYIGLTLHN